MLRVKRELFLQRLNEVAPGLSPKEVVEQTRCLVFQDGQIKTFNEEICCRTTSDLPKDFTGAVQAAPLRVILQKLPEDEIILEQREGLLVVKGKGKETGIRMEKEILLPVAAVETPKKWQTLNTDFTDAVSIVQECAGKDESKFIWTCVHIHPKWMEACDNFQLTRYTLDTGVEKPILVRRDAIKYVPGFDLSEIAETDSWLHFRGRNGLMLSCRRYEDEYQDLSPILKFKGEKAVLPKALIEAAERANVFSEENTDNNQIMVELRPGKLRIRGEGSTGYHLEIKRLKYAGPPMKFMVSPKLLRKRPWTQGSSTTVSECTWPLPTSFTTQRKTTTGRPSRSGSQTPNRSPRKTWPFC